MLFKPLCEATTCLTNTGLVAFRAWKFIHTTGEVFICTVILLF